MVSPIRNLLRALPLLVLAACADSPTATMERAPGDFAAATTDVIALGEAVFNDMNLSLNRNQSCRTCHEPSEGFAAALTGVPTRGSAVQGSVQGQFGARKPPSAAYATLAPNFVLNGGGSGGVFWDGRATGAVLGNPAADQAMGPFLNPVEQALPDEACVVYRVRAGYGAKYTAAWGEGINDITFPTGIDALCSTAGATIPLPNAGQRPLVSAAYQNIARSVAQFEGTFNRFTAKVDLGTMSTLEREGLKLFGGKGKCQQCHLNKGAGALFTDFKFHNLGVPKNPANVEFHYGTSAFDKGLGGVTGNAAHLGKFRTPTTRNVAMGVNRTYMHNGVFTSLKQVVDFYNTRDVLATCSADRLATLHPSQYGSYDPDGAGPLVAAGCWPPPEYARNLDTKQMGALGLTEAQVDAIVAYLRAMSDQ